MKETPRLNYKITFSRALISFSNKGIFATFSHSSGSGSSTSPLLSLAARVSMSRSFFLKHFNLLSGPVLAQVKGVEGATLSATFFLNFLISSFISFALCLALYLLLWATLSPLPLLLFLFESFTSGFDCFDSSHRRERLLLTG